ncbi:hypothetical protein [Hydrogenophaga sp.]|uniref:hypothetical protein n=1 Tax=Hydrogenophaga sp. TaxID=1904254 RepID=UPI003F706A40
MNAPSKKLAKPTKKEPPAPAENSKKTPASNVLEIEGDPLDREKLYADVAIGGMVSNMMLMQNFGKRMHGEVGITQAVKSLRATMKDVHAGNLQSSETLLYSQAVALNTMFAEMACRSYLNMGTYPQVAESYMRLALKAQSQCRNTLETLANIKNPPVVFAKQANISNGPQQVNNGAAKSFETSTRTPARAHEKNGNEPTKLLVGAQHGGTGLDEGATGAATRGHQMLEALGKVHRAEEPGRQGHG